MGLKETTLQQKKCRKSWSGGRDRSQGRPIPQFSTLLAVGNEECHLRDMTRAFSYVGAQFGPFDVDKNAFRFVITALSPRVDDKRGNG
jgi:type IV secretory pathway protease TraF